MMRCVLYAYLVVSLASSQAVPDSTNCAATTQDVTCMMQKSVHLHKQSLSPIVTASAANAEPNARLIGMTKAAPIEAIRAVSVMLQNHGRVDWDGDALRVGRFSNALGNVAVYEEFLEVYAREFPSIEAAEGLKAANKWAMEHSPKEVAYAGEAVPHMLESDMEYYTDSLVGNDYVAPHAEGMTPEQEATANAYMAEHLGGNWDAEGNIDKYGTLAAAVHIAFPPRVVFWLLEEHRDPAMYHNWISLAEYKAFKQYPAGRDAQNDVEWVIVGADGHRLSQAEVEAKPWYPMSPAALGWGGHDLAPAMHMEGAME